MPPHPRLAKVHRSDRTSRRNAALRLRPLLAAERRYQMVFEAASDCVMVIAPDGTVLDVNAAGCALFGRTHADLVGGTFERMLDRQVMRRLVPRPAHIRKERRSIRAEQDLRDRQGRVRRVEVVAGPLPDGNVLAVVRDITDRRRAEQLLATVARGVSAEVGDAFFHSLIRHLTRELGADAAFVGELAEDGLRIRTLVHCVDGRFAPNVELALAGSPSADALALRGTIGYPSGVAARFPADESLAGSGMEGYVGTALAGASGEPLGVLAVMSRQPIDRVPFWRSMLEIFAVRAAAEIERARAEHEVREINARLERRVAERTAELQAANRELESFSYSVSHDLRAPLRAIVGHVGILKDKLGPALDGDESRHMERVERNALRMGELIDDLLDFCKIGRAPLERGPVDMRELVEGVLHDLQGPQRPEVSIVVGDLPPAQGDAVLLRQVWQNLIANAFKFSARAELPTVEIGAARVGDQVEYFVRDNGAGFDPRYAQKLFGVFQRLHTAAEFEGTGVGLAIVHRVIERHGGRVRAEGASGKGACFFFTLGTG